VTRLLDYGQYKYELAKREKEAKRKSRAVEFKEIRLKPKIGQGDFDTKVRRAIDFLEEGDRIKVAVQFRGRELTHPQIGRELLNKFADQVKDHGVLERAPLLEGKSMHITIASIHKPHQREAGAGEKPPAPRAPAGRPEEAAPAAAVDAAGPAPATTGE
jgi:translation initiation factor IF-3